MHRKCSDLDFVDIWNGLTLNDSHKNVKWRTWFVVDDSPVHYMFDCRLNCANIIKENLILIFDISLSDPFAYFVMFFSRSILHVYF